MSDPNCPTCEKTPRFAINICTGRPGCIQKGPDRIPEYKPLGGMMVPEYGPVAPATEGGADIVERLRLKASISRSETDGAESMESAAIDEAADEIARLGTEVERLTRERDEAREDEDRLYDLAYYEVGGVPCLWKVRAEAAERKLHDYGHDDWYCGHVLPGSFKAVPSYSELRAEVERLTGELERYQAGYAYRVGLTGVLQADRAAIATRVAERVQEAMIGPLNAESTRLWQALGRGATHADRAAIGMAYQWTVSFVGILQAVDLAPLVAEVLAREAD